jgi:tetratricopeptide (TPR) repeat protein
MTQPIEPHCTKPIYKKIALAFGAFIAGAFLTGVLSLIGIYLVLLAPLSLYQQSFDAESWKPLNINAGGIDSIRSLKQAEQKLNHLIHNQTDLIQSEFLLASLKERQYQNKEAIRHYESVLDQIKPSPLSQITYQYFARDTHNALLRLHYLEGNGERYYKTVKDEEPFFKNKTDFTPLTEALLNVIENPKRADYRMALASQLHQNLDLVSAKKEYEAAIQLSQDPHLKQEAQMALVRKFPRQLEQLPQEILTWMKLADDLEVKQFDTEKAQEIYQIIVNQVPDFEWGWFHLAQTHKALENPSKAIEFSKKAIQLNPKYPLPYLLLGDLALDNNAYEEALGYFSKALNPIYGHYDDDYTMANVENQIGYCYEQLEKLEQAQTHYENAMKRLDEGFKATLMQTASAEDWDDFDMDATLDDYRAADDDYQYAQEALNRLEETRQQLAVQNSLRQS